MHFLMSPPHQRIAIRFPDDQFKTIRCNSFSSLKGCGTDHISIASHRDRVFAVGGQMGTSQGNTMRNCHIFHLEDRRWEVGPVLNEERWFHGLAMLDNTLYAVGGCGQLNSMEALSLVGSEVSTKEISSML